MSNDVIAMSKKLQSIMTRAICE